MLPLELSVLLHELKDLAHMSAILTLDATLLCIRKYLVLSQNVHVVSSPDPARFIDGESLLQRAYPHGLVSRAFRM